MFLISLILCRLTGMSLFFAPSDGASQPAARPHPEGAVEDPGRDGGPGQTQSSEKHCGRLQLLQQAEDWGEAAQLIRPWFTGNWILQQCRKIYQPCSVAHQEKRKFAFSRLSNVRMSFLFSWKITRKTKVKFKQPLRHRRMNLPTVFCWRGGSVPCSWNKMQRNGGKKSSKTKAQHPSLTKKLN